MVWGIGGLAADFPKSSGEVLALIADAERHRKFVWTAGRVLREATLWTRLEGLPYRERKLMLTRLTTFLEDLAHGASLIAAARRRASATGTRLDLTMFRR